MNLHVQGFDLPLKHRFTIAHQSREVQETARMVLPLCTPTTMYMSGTVRSWIHYVQLRTQEDTQLEHRQIADSIKALMVEHLPITMGAIA